MEMTTTKTFVVFGIIFGCFAVLYPKIFHPMVLHVFGLGGQKQVNDDILSKVPPHLRKGPGPARVIQEDITRHVREEHPGSFRPGPHPGLRAAAEMKKQAGTTTGSGKGMMGVVLPMYAVGIVLYLVYTLTKVFGKKGEEKKEDVLSNNPFSEIQYDATKKEFKYSDGLEDSGDEKDLSKPKKQQRDLERLLLRADERNIRYKQLCDQILSESATAVETEGRKESYFTPMPPFRVYGPKKRAEIEMHQLKARLLETEAQMSRILKAMECVSDKVISKDNGETEEPEETEPEEMEVKQSKRPMTVDSSPDMESYEIINGNERTASQPQSPTVEDIGPATAAGKTQTKESKMPTEKAEKQDFSKQQKNEDAEVEDEEKEDEQEKTEQGADSEPSEEPSAADNSDEIQNNDEVSVKGDEDEEVATAEKVDAVSTDEKIPEKKEDLPQEPRPDLRNRKQGKKARREN